MARIFPLFYLLVVFAMGSSSLATPYYVKNGGNNLLLGDSDANAWATIDRVNAQTFSPGDSINFKRGGVWKEGITMTLAQSGAAGNPIVISAYGPGNMPIISGIHTLPGWDTPGNWSIYSSNIWKFSYAYNPRRLWLNGSEKLTAAILADVGTPNSEGTVEWWFYDTGTKTLYLYATTNPATQYGSLDILLVSAALRLTAGVNYLTINGLDFRGGNTMTVGFDGCSYITLTNCHIGYGNTGLYLTSSDAVSTHHITIDSNVFDSSFNFRYGLSSNGTGKSETRGNEDGIGMWDGVNNCIVRNNTFTGWGHTAITLKGTDGAKDGVYNNEIYNNYFNGSNVSYGRPFATSGVNGKCYNNEFYNNLMENHTVRSQIGGNNNWVHHNIFDGQTNTTARNEGLDGSGQAIWLSVNESTFVCHHNRIDNNLFVNTEEAAIVLKSWNEPSKVRYNYIRNNVFFQTGYNTKRTADSGVAIVVNDTVEENANIFQSNNVFNPGKPLTSAIKYYSALISVADFNGLDGDNGNTIGGNIQIDPLFVDYTNGDFHMLAGSPSIDAGTVIAGLTNDFDGNPIYTGAGLDIGVYESFAPSGLTASATSSNQIKLEWVDNAANEVGFKIERKVGLAGVYEVIATPGVNATVYYDATGLSPNTNYYYRIAAANSSGTSAWSNETNATTRNAATFISIAGEDGSVLESTSTSSEGGSRVVNSATDLWVGDDNQNRQYRAILSFDTSSLPDGATIQSATLRMRRSSVTATNPFDWGGQCQVDIRKGGFNGNWPIENVDFQVPASATNVAYMSSPSSDGDWSTGGLDGSGLDQINKTGRTQFRVYFAIDDNNNITADYMTFFSGNASFGSQPELVVEY